jgi:hypothetical protein
MEVLWDLFAASAPGSNRNTNRASYVELSAATLAIDLHIGEKRYQRMGTHRDDCARVERYQRRPLHRCQAEAIGVAGGIGEKGGAAGLVMGEAVQGDGQFDEFGFDRRVVRFGLPPQRAEPAERGIIVVPARLQRDDVGLAFTKLARGAGPAAKFDIAGVVEFGGVITDQRFEIAGGNSCERLAVPGKVGCGIAFKSRGNETCRRSPAPL